MVAERQCRKKVVWMMMGLISRKPNDRNDRTGKECSRRWIVLNGKPFLRKGVWNGGGEFG